MRYSGGSLIVSTLGMIANNLLFFSVWLIIFNLVDNLRGWTLSDVAMMYGLGASAYGLAGSVFGGWRNLAADIESGRFDAFLVRPASPLALSITSHFQPSCLGDALTGPIFWLLFCQVSFAQFFGLSALAWVGALICVSFGLVVFSCAFWVQGMRNIGEIIMYWLIQFMTMPLHGMPTWAKVIFFTVLPAGFITYLPVEMMRDPSFDKLAYMVLGAAVSLLVARTVFYAGLRQYKGVSGIRTGI
jgi:ABC-2 type transport system permease protein